MVEVPSGPFKPGHDPRRTAKFRPGNEHRWKPGQSGNRVGLPQRRREFEDAFHLALMEQGSADEAAKILWECGRAKEPWAVALLLQRIAPIDLKVKHEVSRGPDAEFDPSALSNEQLEQLISLMDAARGPVIEIEGEVVEERPAAEPEQTDTKEQV